MCVYLYLCCITQKVSTHTHIERIYFYEQIFNSFSSFWSSSPVHWDSLATRSLKGEQTHSGQLLNVWTSFEVSECVNTRHNLRHCPGWCRPGERPAGGPHLRRRCRPDLREREKNTSLNIQRPTFRMESSKAVGLQRWPNYSQSQSRQRPQQSGKGFNGFIQNTRKFTASTL